MNNQNGLAATIVQFVEKLSNTQKREVWMLADFLSFVAGSVLTYILFFDVIASGPMPYFIYTVLSFIFYVLVSKITKLDTRINRYSGMADMSALFLDVIMSTALSGIATILIYNNFSLRYLLLSAMLTGILVVAVRIFWQNIYLNRSRKIRNSGNDTTRRIAVIGAGDGGSLFMNSYKRNPQNMEVIGILDNDPAKIGNNLGGVKVMGDETFLPQLVEDFGVNEVIVAIPSLPPDAYENILRLANDSGVDVYKMPKVEDVLQGVYQSREMKKVDISDLLGRQEVELEEDRLRTELEGKTILITGAGGSIGSEISRQVSKFNPRRVLLLGHGENSIYNIYNELLGRQNNTIQYSPIIADVQDFDRLVEIFETEQPDIVYHAAAHKHVPLMELNPTEALKNNIHGSYNVARAVDKAKVPKMVMISTDKAVNPPNVMGASKRVAELLVTGMNAHSESTFCAVRFGNVLGSRGSVIPVFERQIAAGGPVTVTDFRMTRYFMTIPEASRLVIYAGAHAGGGEVFILDMGDPVRILDLAKKMILLSGHTENEIEIVESGIRPGEKLYEELLTSAELVENQIDEKIFIGRVADMPLEETAGFVASLDVDEPENIKERLIDFANQSHVQADEEPVLTK